MLESPRLCRGVELEASGILAGFSETIDEQNPCRCVYEACRFQVEYDGRGALFRVLLEHVCSRPETPRNLALERVRARDTHIQRSEAARFMRLSCSCPHY